MIRRKKGGRELSLTSLMGERREKDGLIREEKERIKTAVAGGGQHHGRMLSKL